jgi:uncharacterized membrane protein YgcG
MNDRPPPSEAEDLTIPDRVHPRTRYRYAFRVSLAISAVIHLILIALFPGFFSGIPRIGMSFGGYTQLESPQGTELVNILELPADQEPDIERPPDVSEPEIPNLPTQAVPTGIEALPRLEPPDEGPVGPTAAERIRPKAQDLRYWAPVSPERTQLTQEQVMRLQLVARLEALNDSLAKAEKRAVDAMDWTYTDDEGKRWGVSPGKIHLGDLTIPMPFAFGTSAGQRERAEERLWAWDEIEASAARGAVIESWKNRDQAIRERMDARRRADTTRSGGRGGGGGGGSGGGGGG